MESSKTTIYVVDEDPGIGRALLSVGQLLDTRVESFSSVGEFLNSFDASSAGCVVLDVKLPDMSGLELQQDLATRSVAPPVIMLSSQANVRLAVEAMTLGAVTFLEKPCRLEELVRHVRRALEINSARRRLRCQAKRIGKKLAQLTKKEREVFDLLVQGETNKSIAVSLGLSVRAVEDRRARLMKKLKARTAVDLLAMLQVLERVQWGAVHEPPSPQEAGGRCVTVPYGRAPR